ncbi:hypothetical protein QFC19_009463 [Naganishia cerealis]|uniref:Uncharacterized protein n=1 Tax=Naganishia cerealis TaxID=610337 RepID=A0ACC2UVS2_9TREE|nr:hypothetical protein QFC19_009463 [Naganishia cerealis]
MSSAEAQAGGVCQHLQSCSQDAIKDLQARYRKVMNWCIREEMDPGTTRGDKTLQRPARRLPKCHLCKQTTSQVCRIRTDGNEDSARVSSRAPPTGSGGKIKVKKVVVDHPGSHAKSTGHSFSVDGSTGAIFCHLCDDFVYAEVFDSWRNRALRTMEERLDISADVNGKRAKFKVWKASPADKAAMDRSEAVRCHSIRPLLNLSQTCFLSAILQAFFHNPLLKQYFLNEGHNRRTCESTRSTTGTSLLKIHTKDDGTTGTGVGECMGCEMDSAFIEAYNGEGTPFGPTALLLSMWKASAELAGHEQQDEYRGPDFGYQFRVGDKGRERNAHAWRVFSPVGLGDRSP